ncbi:MAG TPA: hypothetical protein VN027_16455 [Isoptericola sp.]|nr:hypothetical protein [Isoptericola sp.]
MSSKLQEIAALEDGWWGPRSRAVPSEIIALVDKVLPELADIGVHVVIAPHSSGSILLEWSRPGMDYTAEIRPDGSMILSTDDVERDDYEERVVPADTKELREFVGAL